LQLKFQLHINSCLTINVIKCMNIVPRWHQHTATNECYYTLCGYLTPGSCRAAVPDPARVYWCAWATHRIATQATHSV